MGRGLLLGSGGTLNRPIGGRWNPRADIAFSAVLGCCEPDARMYRAGCVISRSGRPPADRDLPSIADLDGLLGLLDA